MDDQPSRQDLLTAELHAIAKQLRKTRLEQSGRVDAATTSVDLSELRADLHAQRERLDASVIRRTR